GVSAGAALPVAYRRGVVVHRRYERFRAGHRFPLGGEHLFAAPPVVPDHRQPHHPTGPPGRLHRHLHRIHGGVPPLVRVRELTLVHIVGQGGGQLLLDELRRGIEGGQRLLTVSHRDPPAGVRDRDPLLGLLHRLPGGG